MQKIQIGDVKTIVWDFDGTLVDSFDLTIEILQEITSERNMEMPSRDFLLLHYHGSLAETLAETLQIGGDELDSVVAAFFRKQDDHYAGDATRHLYEDAMRLSNQAAEAGITQIIVTNRVGHHGSSTSPSAIISRTVLSGNIQDVLCGDEVEYRKPDGRVLDKWLGKNRASPKDILVVGDQFVDAKLANNLGARCVLVKRNGEVPHLEDDDQAILVNSLDDIELIRAKISPH